MTKVTIENCYGEVSVSTIHDDLTLAGITNALVYPVLLAAGYNPEDIKEYIPR